MGNLFNSYIYQPILDALIFIYRTLAFHDLGLSIVMLTVLVRAVLFPIFYKGTRDQTLMQHLQPHIKKIQLDHKDDKEKQAKELLDLYKKHRLNPFSGLLLLLVQLPIFIALFQVFTRGLGGGAFDSNSFLGLINLGAKSIVVALLAAGLQYLQGRLALPKAVAKDSGNPMASMGRTMVVMGPVLTLVILWNLPSAIGLYWVTSTIFSVFQQLYINRHLPVPPEVTALKTQTNQPQ